MNYNIFKYHVRHELVYNNSSILENFSMYSQHITITKNIDNKFYFNVVNHDRITQQLPGKTLLFYIVNDEQDQTKLIKPLDIEDAEKGRYILSLTRRDIIDIPVGHNRGFVVIHDDYTNEENLIFSGEDFNPLFDIDVVDNVFVNFTPSLNIKLNDWRYDDHLSAYISGVIDSNRIINRSATIYTTSVKVSDFIGTFKIQTTYENSKTLLDNEWEDVCEYFFGREATEEELEENPTQLYYPINETKEFTIDSMGQYFRFIHIPYTKCEVKGKIEKILFRS